jgi:putative hemolysin
MEILIIILLTLLNSFFSLSEIALVSVKKSRMQQLASKGSSRAQTVLNLLESPENFLSSVQVGITLIGIVSGAYGGATLTDDMDGVLSQFSFLGSYTHTISLILVIGSITYFSIVVGELVPKTLAMNNAENIALITVPIIKYFTYATYPFVKLLSFSTKFILRIFGAKDSDTDHVSEEELIFLLKNAGKSGVLEREESEVHQNIFMFSDQTAKSLMVHSSEVDWVNSNWSTSEILNHIIQSNHSKFIVSDGNVDKVRGVMRVKDFLENYNLPEFSLKDIMDEPFFISHNMPAFNILTKFKQTRQYMGCVLDEYGGFIGIITLHDLVEGIIGELPEEDDEASVRIVSRQDNTFLIDGKTPLFELNKYFQKEIIEQNHQHYTTVAGFILDKLKALPKVGDKIVFENTTFEVVDIDGRRIDKVLMSFKVQSNN